MLANALANHDLVLSFLSIGGEKKYTLFLALLSEVDEENHFRLKQKEIMVKAGISSLTLVKLLRELDEKNLVIKLGKSNYMMNPYLNHHTTDEGFQKLLWLWEFRLKEVGKLS
jgi:predicted transcriptional regulator